MKIRFAVPALFVFAAVSSLVLPAVAEAQPRPTATVRVRTQTVHDRGTHIHDHSARPHVDASAHS